MEAVYPAAASALSRGRRARTPGQRARRRTVPVTFAEIKEVDEENDEATATAESERPEERRRRLDLLLPEHEWRRLRPRARRLTEEPASPAAAQQPAGDT